MFFLVPKNFKQRFCLNQLGSEELIIEQHRLLAKRIPNLYWSVIITAACIFAAYMGTAPNWLIISVPLVLLLFSLHGLLHWSRVSGKIDSLSLLERKKDIALVTFTVPVMSLVFAVFGVSLVHFGVHSGVPHQQALALLLIWATMVLSASSLTIIPAASIPMVITASVPIIFAFNNSGVYILGIMSFACAALSMLSVFYLLVNFRAFSNIVNSRSQLKKKNNKIQELANTDPLTGLANRRKFKEQLINRVTASERAGRKFAVCILDLDSFKQINNLFNHIGGDHVLTEVGQRLARIVGTSGVVARLSSDEFHIQIGDVCSAYEAEKLGFAIHNTLRAPFFIDGSPVHISTSIGIAIYPQAGTDAGHLVKHAAQAQNRAKLGGGGKTCVFTLDMEKEVLENSRLEMDLKSAIKNDEIEVYFQPIVDLQTGEYVSFETLARWIHPIRGFVPPDVFIQLAEEKGLIEALTVNLLRKAAAVAAKWPSDIKVAFNLSAEQICNPNFALTILAILNEAGLPPSRFEAELTETAIMADMKNALLMINNLREVGISISLDDFGTGYSSLSQITNLPLDKLKVDKSFVDDICTSDKIRNIIRTILSLCSVLELNSVCEGIETYEQLEALRAAGGSLGQGYLFSKPVPADQLTSSFFYKPLKDAA